MTVGVGVTVQAVGAPVAAEMQAVVMKVLEPMVVGTRQTPLSTRAL